MSLIAKTPQPPCYAVIFSKHQTEATQGYEAMAAEMLRLASQQEGYPGMKALKQALAIGISYWRDL